MGMMSGLTVNDRDIFVEIKCLGVVGNSRLFKTIEAVWMLCQKSKHFFLYPINTD